MRWGGGSKTRNINMSTTAATGKNIGLEMSSACFKLYFWIHSFHYTFKLHYHCCCKVSICVGFETAQVINVVEMSECPKVELQ